MSIPVLSDIASATWFICLLNRPSCRKIEVKTKKQINNKINRNNFKKTEK